MSTTQREQGMPLDQSRQCTEEYLKQSHRLRTSDVEEEPSVKDQRCGVGCMACYSPQQPLEHCRVMQLAEREVKALKHNSRKPPALFRPTHLHLTASKVRGNSTMSVVVSNLQPPVEPVWVRRVQ